jgi:hypothetical protein
MNSKNSNRITLEYVSLVLRSRHRLPPDAISLIALYVGLCWQRHNGTVVRMPRPIKQSIPKPIVPKIEYAGSIQISQGPYVTETSASHVPYRLRANGKNVIKIPTPVDKLDWCRFLRNSSNPESWNMLEYYSHDRGKTAWVRKVFDNKGDNKQRQTEWRLLANINMGELLDN